MRLPLVLLILALLPIVEGGQVDNAALVPGTPGQATTSFAFTFSPTTAILVGDTLKMLLTPIPSTASAILANSATGTTLTVSQANCKLTVASGDSTSRTWTVGENTTGACSWPASTPRTISLTSDYFASVLPSELVAFYDGVTLTRSGSQLDTGSKLVWVVAATINYVTATPSTIAVGATPSITTTFQTAGAGLIPGFILKIYAIRRYLLVPVFQALANGAATVTVGSCTGTYLNTSTFVSDWITMHFQLSGSATYCTPTGGVNTTVIIPSSVVAAQTPDQQQVQFQVTGLGTDNSVYWNIGPGNPSAKYTVGGTSGGTSGSVGLMPTAVVALAALLGWAVLQ